MLRNVSLEADVTLEPKDNTWLNDFLDDLDVADERYRETAMKLVNR